MRYRGRCTSCMAHGTRLRSRRLSDGSPALKGGQIVARAARWGRSGGPRRGRGGAGDLFYGRLARAGVIGVFPLSARPAGTAFALTRDGRRFARPLDSRRLEVRDVPGDQPPILVTPSEDVWIHFATLGKSCLAGARVRSERAPARPVFMADPMGQGWLDLPIREADSRPRSARRSGRGFPERAHGEPWSGVRSRAIRADDRKWWAADPDRSV